MVEALRGLHQTVHILFGQPANRRWESLAFLRQLDVGLIGHCRWYERLLHIEVPQLGILRSSIDKNTLSLAPDTVGSASDPPS